MKIEVPERMQEEFVKAVAHLALDESREALEAQIKKAVDTAIDESMKAGIAERIKIELDRLLAEGWPKTDTYGREVKRVTLKDLVLEMLTSHDRYSGNGMWVDRQINEHAQAALKKVFEPEIKAAQEKFRAQVDGVLNAKLNEALRASLGLK